jgi:hypothetical protein
VTAGEVAALLTSVGAGAVLLKLVELLWKWLGGRAGRERDVVARERARAEDAERRMTAADLEADTEMRRRRKAQEYAAKLRRHAIERGVEPSDLPPWPSELLD